ncbi:hypothetical protein BFW38_04395 [Terasakiispira papahanaumokuakeensis]|uniref:Chemotaxis protein n=1 Tax=Terasakiispira papahanaumokuakeensis TaxID=197479 RepID=A0A1E2V7F5_9GAMM|nr:methyl-accepting chemotaxis protein [Terasakiispira papahanaumokuakeensis]ODC02904.1 hypothetical protein BFW38_04395 [Terasakiispira papahanaumokuakeensis]
MFKRLTQRFQLFLAAVLAAVLGIAIVGVLAMQHVINGYDRLLVHDLSLERDVSHVALNFKVQVQEWKNVLLRGHQPEQMDKYWGRFQARAKDIQSALAQVAARVQDDTVKQDIRQFLSAYQTMMTAYAEGRNKFIASGFDPQAGDQAVQGIDREPTAQMEALAQHFADQAAESSVILGEQADNRIMMILTALLVGAVLVLLLAGWLGRKGLVRPILHLRASVVDLSEGRFNQPVHGVGREDELGDMARATQRLQDHLRSSVTSMEAAVSGLNQSVTELTEVAEGIRHGVSDQSQRTELVAAAMNEMVSTVQEIAQSAAHTAESANEADRHAVDGGERMAQAASDMQTLENEVETLAADLDQLVQHTREVSGVLDVISGIAEQTNLLALNAAIEAARAGEHGRGFAVVADEVRQLASRTQESTEQVARIIDQVQRGAGNVVESMRVSQEQTQVSTRNVQSGHEMLTFIIEAVSKMRDMTTQIAAAAEEQGQVAEEINQNIVSVSEVAQHNESQTASVAGTADQLAHLAHDVEMALKSLKNQATH